MEETEDLEEATAEATGVQEARPQKEERDDKKAEGHDDEEPLGSSQPERFSKKEVWAKFQARIEQHGGAQQYLLQRYPTPERRDAFAADLRAYFPRRADLDYHTGPQCPAHDQDVFLHLCDLGFDPMSTTKPPPYKTVCLQLGEEILTNGFTTRGDYA